MLARLPLLHPEGLRGIDNLGPPATSGHFVGRPHDLKHTEVALLPAAGVDPSIFARRAGRSNVTFTYDCYGLLFPEPNTMAAAKIEAIRTTELGIKLG